MAVEFCPVRAFWPWIRRRVAPGELLTQWGSRRNLNRIPKAAHAKLSIPESHRYTPTPSAEGRPMASRSQGDLGRRSPPPGSGIPQLSGDTLTSPRTWSLVLNICLAWASTRCRRARTSKIPTVYIFKPIGRPVAVAFHGYRGLSSPGWISWMSRWVV